MIYVFEGHTLEDWSVKFRCKLYMDGTVFVRVVRGLSAAAAVVLCGLLHNS